VTRWVLRVLVCLLSGVLANVALFVIAFSIAEDGFPSVRESLPVLYVFHHDLWMVPAGAALLALSLFVRDDFVHRRSQAKLGCCPKCSYDLRGAQEKGCSECGWNRALRTD
jgi:hypothetical protein